jgi:hypothetical protein
MNRKLTKEEKLEKYIDCIKELYSKYHDDGNDEWLNYIAILLVECFCILGTAEKQIALIDDLFFISAYPRANWLFLLANIRVFCEDGNLNFDF